MAQTPAAQAPGHTETHACSGLFHKARWRSPALRLWALQGPNPLAVKRISRCVALCVAGRAALELLWKRKGLAVDLCQVIFSDGVRGGGGGVHKRVNGDAGWYFPGGGGSQTHSLTHWPTKGESLHCAHTVHYF